MGNLKNGISIYSGIDRIKEQRVIPLDLFLEDIKEGKWQDLVLKIRLIEDEAERNAAKKGAPCVTIAGTFKERYDANLLQHSGYVAIDIDKVKDPEALKTILSEDKYVVAVFTSISGRGLCVLFKVVPAKHKEAFQGIGEYLYNEYKIVNFDPTSINVSRPRFVSWDPNIYINEGQVPTFTSYPKNKPPKRVEKVIYSDDDFGEILAQVVSRRLNLCDNYYEWLRIGFALVHQFSENGRQYFHTISQYSRGYNSNLCDQQYSACLRHKSSDVTTISTFYYYAKEAGLSLYTERTKKIAYSAINGKKGGLNAIQIAENLEKYENITGAEDIIKQVMDNNIELDEEGLLEQLEMLIRQSCELRRNDITRYIENKNIVLQQKDLNTIFIKAKKIFEKLNYELMDRLINSDFVPGYDPLLDFFEKHKDAYPVDACKGNIEKLFSSVKTRSSELLLYYGTKWLGGLISTAHGEHSPLMLVLVGETQGTGKTEFFRRLLPKELQSYFAESKLDAGKDDEILMCQKWIIADDEMGGKSKKESKRLKELTSKQVFSLREPYGRNNVELRRLAVLCGSTNDNEILNDPTGNRRILPFEVFSIDHEIYNGVDKVGLLMEIYYMVMNGFEWKLTREDIEQLKENTDIFQTTKLEEELISKYYRPGTDHDGERMTATDIKVALEGWSNQKLFLDAVGKSLKSLGFIQKNTRIDGKVVRTYFVEKLIQGLPPTEVDDLPF